MFTKSLLTATLLSIAFAPVVSSGTLESQIFDSAASWTKSAETRARLNVPQALLPGHLGSILTMEEQRMLIEAWTYNDDEAAHFILSGGTRGAFTTPATD